MRIAAVRSTPVSVPDTAWVCLVAGHRVFHLETVKISEKNVPAAMARFAAEAIARTGTTTFEFKVGRFSAETPIETIRAVRQALGESITLGATRTWRMTWTRPAASSVPSGRFGSTGSRNRWSRSRTCSDFARSAPTTYQRRFPFSRPHSSQKVLVRFLPSWALPADLESLFGPSLAVNARHGRTRSRFSRTPSMMPGNTIKTSTIRMTTLSKRPA